MHLTDPENLHVTLFPGEKLCTSAGKSCFGFCLGTAEHVFGPSNAILFGKLALLKSICLRGKSATTQNGLVSDDATNGNRPDKTRQGERYLYGLLGKETCILAQDLNFPGNTSVRGWTSMKKIIQANILFGPRFLEGKLQEENLNQLLGMRGTDVPDIGSN